MFDTQVFRTWPHIVMGAALFALLFGSAVAMGEALVDGAIGMTRTVVGLGMAAFVGYIGVAVIVRYEGDESG